MTRPLPLSVFIIAKNEADRLPYTLESVYGLADEIIVVDSGSTDQTCEIAKSWGASVLTKAWEGYGPQKVFAEAACRHDWVLNLDADEALSPELIAEIRTLFDKGEPPAKGYFFKINILLSYQDKLPFIGAGTKQLRLYHRAFGGFKKDYVHDTVIMKNPQERTPLLKNQIIHRCFRGYHHAMEKINFYSTMQAEDRFKKGRNPSALLLTLVPPLAFLKCYFLRKYCFYGVEGIVQSYVYAIGRFLRLAKTRERFRQDRDQKAGHLPPKPPQAQL